MIASHPMYTSMYITCASLCYLWAYVASTTKNLNWDIQARLRLLENKRGKKRGIGKWEGSELTKPVEGIL